MAVSIESNNVLPFFGKIEFIIKSDDQIYFVLRGLRSVKMIEHIQSYLVNVTDDWYVIKRNDFPSHIAHNVFRLPCNTSVISCM